MPINVVLSVLCRNTYLHLLFICGNVTFLGYEMSVYELSNVNHPFTMYNILKFSIADK